LRAAASGPTRPLTASSSRSLLGQLGDALGRFLGGLEVALRRAVGERGLCLVATLLLPPLRERAQLLLGVLGRLDAREQLLGLRRSGEPALRLCGLAFARAQRLLPALGVLQLQRLLASDAQQ
jgi:hypothetical protein